MRSFFISAFSYLSIFLVFLLLVSRTGTGDEVQEEDERRAYVVYMGSATPNANDAADAMVDQHFQLLASVVESEEGRHRKAIIRRYRHGFTGFAALLTAEEALAIGRSPGVVSVFPDPVFQLHTTRSWDFLDLQSSESIFEFNPIVSVAASGDDDSIIGLLDTGIWPESASFNDENIGAIPPRWNGTCQKGDDFNASNCNRKLIGARFYDSGPVLSSLDQSPRDNIGHGTHTASTAAGSPVQGASYYSLANGTAKGGSPSSRIAMYKVCSEDGCTGSAILAAFDDAIGDGVDVLSLSLGASPFLLPDFVKDPIAIGALHAVAKGIVVVCSAGNSGPMAGTVVNAAPWILTVAATTIDRNFISDVVLGDKTVCKGEAINFSKLNKSAVYPLVYGGSTANSNDSQASARSCDPGSLDEDKVKENIVFCMNTEKDLTKREKAEGLRSLGAKGLVLADDDGGAVATTSLSLPLSVVSLEDGEKILAYINSTRNPVATILPTETVMGDRPAPAVAEFSSRGPSIQTGNILKPDISAPGVDVLAAWPLLNNSIVVPPGERPTPFNLISGTSMACPHVSGVAASIRSSHPDWSPSAIKSAIMTTAIQMNDAKAPITTDSGSTATGYDYGAGEVIPSAANQPGLVYELEMKDYLQFLCNYGYNETTIGIISPLPDGFKCSKDANAELISDLNYPSIAVSMSGKDNRTVSRRVTNVGEEEETTYTASIKSPDGLQVKVTPSELRFTKESKKLSYQVTFSSSSESKTKQDEDLFGTITWSNGKNEVKSIFVVANKQ